MNSIPAQPGAPATAWPEVIRDETELIQRLTQPRPVLVDFIRTLRSPLVILGAGGKMGPTLAVLAKRAAEMAGHTLDVVAVSRFSDRTIRSWLESQGVATVSADLLNREEVQRLPEAMDLVYLVGLKFGTSQEPDLTWAANAVTPTFIMERYAAARLAALSTGNVYPLVPVATAGAEEDHPLTPLGEYPNSAIARERIFAYFSRRNGTRVSLLRLCYAVELRYGVLVDIARKVQAEEPIELANAGFNCIWQGDANEMILRALDLAASPARPWNLTCPGSLSVRGTAERFGELLGKTPRLVGQEGNTALLVDASRICSALGTPPTPMEAVMRWIAAWVRAGGPLLNQPTHFEVRDGQY